MKLSTRVRYGVRAMVELAKQKENKPIPLRKLAENQAISPKYLEQMAASLKIAGLIESVRGAEGGYQLARPASEITVLDVYNVLDVSGDPINCVDPPCDRLPYCATRELWSELIDSIQKVLSSRTLQQLANRELKLEKTKPAKKKTH
jgi:Rrf2 family protein